MLRILDLVFTALLVPAFPAEAQEVQVGGPRLTDDCRKYASIVERGRFDEPKSDVAQSMFCFGFVLGVVDTHSTLLGGRGVECVPAGTDAKAMTEIVARYLSEHPGQRHLPGFLLVLEALSDTFPCDP